MTGAANHATMEGRRHALFVVLLVLLLLSPPGVWGEELRPPCGTSPLPRYAEVAGPPAVQVWKEGDAGSRWEPPACTGWGSRRFDLVVAVAGRFQSDDRVETVLARFGAVSRLAGMRYWSVSKKGWRDLITEAYALDGPAGKHRRADFAEAEMKPGRDLYFKQTNGGSGSVVYRMRVREVASDRLVLETENTTAVRLVAMPLFKPGDLRSLYFFERSSPGVWSYYGLTGVHRGTSPLARGHEPSYINRAVAIFRHAAGIPTDQEPPAAP